MDDDSRQPWLPDGYAERLTVGARVRVHLSAECETTILHRNPVPETIGTIAVVESADDGMGIHWLGHPYWVRFECPTGKYPIQWRYFAASELIPLDDGFRQGGREHAAHNTATWERLTAE